MKVDKANPAHWLRLALFGVNVLVAMLLRKFRRRPRRGNRVVVLYGHRLNGNLLAMYRYWDKHARNELDMVFLTMDKQYYKILKADCKEAALATRPGALHLLSNADAVVSDHGLHAMSFMVGHTDLKFFDVWHGIPFKGFDERDFLLQQRYDETWVASECCRELYVERYGFDAARVHVTGYARTDRLVDRRRDDAGLRESLRIPHGRRTILFAPTWAQDDRERSIFPFECSEPEFMGALSSFAEAHEATILLRTHLNIRTEPSASHPYAIALSSRSHPDTESVLLASDVLVCDWSSIAFDYLLLRRPTIFLDVPPPFRKGFSFGPEYRFGATARNLSELLQALHVCLDDAEFYWCKHSEAHQRVQQEVYGRNADGRSAERCMARLRFHLFGSQFNA